MHVSSAKALRPELSAKLGELQSLFRDKTVVVAFSGGVDSSLVSELAHRFGRRMVAVTGESITVLPGEVDLARELATNRGWEHRVVAVNELENEDFAKNPNNRCYYCKAGLSKELQAVAHEIGANMIVEGTNLSELQGHRPGLKAIQENNIVSPFLIVGIGKDEIRTLARFFGLPNADKPSMPCLSSRFPQGVRITPEKLFRVGSAERYLIDTYNIKTLRVRDHEGIARIEIDPEERFKLLDPQILDDIDQKLRSLGFQFVTIDCRGYRSGGLSEILLDSSLEISIRS